MNGPYRRSPPDPCKTLGQGDVRYFRRIIDLANAFAKAEAPWKTVIYDDGCEARELNRNETWMLETVCGILGYDAEDYRQEAATYAAKQRDRSRARRADAKERNARETRREVVVRGRDGAR